MVRQCEPHRPLRCIYEHFGGWTAPAICGQHYGRLQDSQLHCCNSSRLPGRRPAAGSAALASKCLYVNETYPFLKTPTFAVQQLASIFDTQCNLAGQVYELAQGVSAMLQVDCIVGRGSSWQCVPPLH